MPRCRHASDTFPSVSANSSTLMRCRASFSSAFIGFSPCAYYAPILSSEKPSSTNYEWPQFEQREYSDKFWGEHLEILRRGDEYKNKIGYIDRILAVLYRIRPDSPALGKRIPFLETVQQTNGRLKWYRNVNRSEEHT